MNSTLLIN